jgi:hypothetical protein
MTVRLIGLAEVVEDQLAEAYESVDPTRRDP